MNPFAAAAKELNKLLPDGLTAQFDICDNQTENAHRVLAVIEISSNETLVMARKGKITFHTEVKNTKFEEWMGENWKQILDLLRSLPQR